MNKSAIGGVVAVVIVLAGGGLLLANSQNSDSDKKTPTTTDHSNMKMDNDTPSNSDSSADESSNTPAATSSVTIKDLAFSPANITVKVGTKVTWTNQDSVQHDVVSDSGSDSPSSELLSKGESYSFTFTKAGTFSYHCTPHPFMKGTITVTE